MRPATLSALACALVLADVALTAPAHPQTPFVVTPHDELATSARRKLRGRFLHITDMHPDPHYRNGASLSSSCHRKKPKKEPERAPYLGVPFGDCDSPQTLTNYTMDYLEKHWAKEIDFVIWTGDSARHDNDRKLPRTPGEIYELNRQLTARFEKVFSSRGIPVVPTLGNNDIWPHNIMTPGPNSITNEYSSIWRSFIPFSSYQVFQRGGYFSVEVIPNEVAVISLNTNYFYDNNKAVGGCEYGDHDDPGNLQYDWLEVQLTQFRRQRMQVWISGHVPPSYDNYATGCFVRYVDLALRFQDTILGHLYGHMNADHFFILEKDDLTVSSRRRSRSKHKLGRDVDAISHASLADTLIESFAELPKKSKEDLDDYAVINVSPSVVPNPYLPSFRIFAYNVTGSPFARADDEDELEAQKNLKKQKKKKKHNKEPEMDCSQKENRKKWECRPKKPQHADPESPSRTNRLWTPLGYAQYWLPDVGEGNKTHRPKFKLEYLTFALPSLHPERGGDNLGTGEDTDAVRYPIPLKELPRPLRNSTTSKSKYAPYGLPDLTIASWLRLGRRLGDKKRTKLRSRFRKYLSMGKGED